MPGPGARDAYLTTPFEKLRDEGGIATRGFPDCPSSARRASRRARLHFHSTRRRRRSQSAPLSKSLTRSNLFAERNAHTRPRVSVLCHQIPERSFLWLWDPPWL